MSTAVRFTDEDLAAIDAVLVQLDQHFNKLVATDAKARKRMFKMGNKSEAFCRQALTVLDQNRQLVPPAMDLNKALTALRTIDELRPRAKQILALAERMKNTEQALGADVATAARQGYKSLGEYGDRHGLEGMRQALSARFSRQGKRRKSGDVGNEDQAA